MDRLNTGETLAGGQDLLSPNGAYRLSMQQDGNLVLYANGVPYWESQTYGLPAADTPVRAAMQTDANFVLYDAAGNARWASGTWGNDAVQPYALMQDDGNFVVYHDGGSAVWASGGVGAGGALPGRGFVDLVPDADRLTIPMTTADLGEGHWMQTTVELLNTGQVTVNTRLTCTNKWAGFTGGVKLVYVDVAGNKLGESSTEQIGINQAPIFGASHRDHTFFDAAPKGTADVALLQFWAPKNRLAEILQGVEDVVDAIVRVAELVGRICQNHPAVCEFIVKLVFGSSQGGPRPSPNPRVIVM